MSNQAHHVDILFQQLRQFVMEFPQDKAVYNYLILDKSVKIAWTLVSRPDLETNIIGVRVDNTDFVFSESLKFITKVEVS